MVQEEENRKEHAIKTVTAVLLAAGRGTRMQSAERKQFMLLGGKPVLQWSLDVLAASRIVTDLVLAAPPEEMDEVRRRFVDPLPKESFAHIRVVPGGAERCDSVYHCIKAIDWPCDYVFIHDGARPLLTESMLERLLEAVERYGAVVAACPSKDTVKITGEDGFVSSTPDRAHVWNIQTPQCFAYDIVKSAYEKLLGDGLSGNGPALKTGEAVHGEDALKTAYRAGESRISPEGPTGITAPKRPRVTDDAMVVEYAGGHRVRPVDTGYQNIKITTPEDLLIASVLLRGRERG